MRIFFSPDPAEPAAVVDPPAADPPADPPAGDPPVDPPAPPKPPELKKGKSLAAGGDGDIAPKGEGDPPPADPKATPPPSGDPKVPVKASDLNLPEDTLLPAETTEGIAAFAKAQGLSKAQSQAILDRDHAWLNAMAEARDGQVALQAAEWMKETRNHKDLGGAKFMETAALSSRVIAKFGGEKMQAILDESGFGNHPEVLGMLVKIGRAIGDDKLVLGTPPPQGRKTIEERWGYGTGDVEKPKEG